MLARTQKTPIWERTRAVQRLRHQLREYFPAALEVFEDLDAPDMLELLGKAPDRQLVRVWVERFADQVVDRAVLLGRADVVMQER